MIQRPILDLTNPDSEWIHLLDQIFGSLVSDARPMKRMDGQS